MTQIDADLKVKSQAYNSLKGNLQNLERKATYVIYLIIFKFKLEVDIILLLLLSTSSVTTMECGPCTLFDSVAHFRSDYYQLQSLWPAVRRVQCSSEDATKLMVQAFVISCLDYCNGPCYGITNELTRCLQSVEIAATMLVMGTRQCDHAIISRLCSASCTGFLCGSASCSRLRLSSTGPCPATPWVTWSMTVSLSPTPPYLYLVTSEM